jgi:phosphate-selective porin
LAPAALPAQAPPATIVASGHAASVTFGGLVQVQAEIGDKGDTRFANGNDRIYLRRARLGAAGKFLEEFDFRLVGEFSAGSIGNVSAARAQITDGYVNWNRYAFANVTAGQFKTPFGFEQLYPDPKVPTIERSLVSDRLTLSRQLGVQAGGDLLDQRITWALGAFNGNGANNNFNDNGQFAIVGRLAGKPWRGRLFDEEATLAVGGGGYSSDDTGLSLLDLGVDSTPNTPDRDGLFTGTRRGSAVDAEFTTARFEVWGEAMRVHFEPDDAIPRRSFDAEGWMVLGTWMALPKRLQAVLKEESFDPLHGVDGLSTRTTTVGVNWFLKSDDLRLSVDYLHVDVDRQPSQQKVLARMQVIF